MDFDRVLLDAGLHLKMTTIIVYYIEFGIGTFATVSGHAWATKIMCSACGVFEAHL